jgi:hypothetical protein
MTRHHTRFGSILPSPARAVSVPRGRGVPRAAGGAQQKRSIVQWLLLIAILILPW